MTLKNVPVMEWHEFKRKCPNVRKYLNELSDRCTHQQKAIAEAVELLKLEGYNLDIKFKTAVGILQELIKDK